MYFFFKMVENMQMDLLKSFFGHGMQLLCGPKINQALLYMKTYSNLGFNIIITCTVTHGLGNGV